MSLKNSIKQDPLFISSATASNGSIVTVVGARRQTSMKECIMIKKVYTTPGGEIVSASSDWQAPLTFDNQEGIRKEFYMGYSICHPDDVNDYDVNIATQLATRRFSRPLVTYNFTYLNDDMCQLLVDNEADYISNNIDKYINRKHDK